MPDPDLSKLEGGYTEADDSVLAKLEGGAREVRDNLAQSAGTSAQESPNEQLQTLKDAGTMVPAGFTDDHDDEIMGILGGIGAALGQPFKDPRTTAPKGYRTQRDAQRGRKAEAMDRSPIAGTAAFMGGNLAQTALAGAALKGTGALTRAAKYATGTAEAGEGAGLLARVRTGLGNAAAPGAIIGAGQAENLEDVPEAAATGALIGTAAATAAKLPGGIRRMFADPEIASRATTGAQQSAMRVGGHTKGDVFKIAQRPGGVEKYLADRERLGIGKGFIPTTKKTLDQADRAVSILDTEAQALAEQAKHLNIPVEDLSRDLERKGKLQTTTDRDIAAKYRTEAQAHREMSGRPVYETISGRHAPEALYEPPPPTGPIPGNVENMGPRQGYTQVKPQAPPRGPMVTPPPGPGPQPDFPALPENGIKRPVVTPSPRQEYPELGEGPTRVQGHMVGDDPMLGPGNPEIQGQVGPVPPRQLPQGVSPPLLPPGEETGLAQAPIQAQSRWMGQPPAKVPPGGPPGAPPRTPGGPLDHAQADALSPTPGGPLARVDEQQGSALATGDPWSETYQTGREMTFPEMVKERQSAHRKGFNAFDNRDTAGGDFYRDVGTSINDILERHANANLPGEVGSQMRAQNRDLATAIGSRDFAQRGMAGGSDLMRGGKIAAGVAAAGVGLPGANAARDVPLAAGLLASHPGVQQRFWESVGAVGRAAQRAPDTTLGRILTKYGPSGEALSRAAVHGAAQEGITEVQKAALQGDDAAVSKHYELMLTNPEYNREAMGEE